MNKKAVTVFFLVFFFSFSLLVTAQTTMQVPAVDAEGRGMITSIQARVVSGNGGVYVDIEPFVSVDTQNSARTAVKIAAQEAGVNPQNFDVLYKIVADAEIVDGPSGGAALALLAYAEFTGRKPRPDMAVTGTIERDGSIGKISGVTQKLDAVHAAGLNLFVVPSGQSVQSGVDLSVYAEREWGIQVVEAGNAKELIVFAYSSPGTKVNASRKGLPPLSVRPMNASLFTRDFKALVETETKELLQVLEGLEDGGQAESLKTEVRQALNDSRLLLENGYYYSAANTVFLAKIGVDVFALSHQNLSREGFKAMLDDLRQDIEDFKPSNKTFEGMEWSIGAIARLKWAEDRLQEVIEDAELQPPLALLEDYASAVNWFDAAKKMDAIAASKKGRELDEFKARDYAQTLLDQAKEFAASPLALVDAEIVWHLTLAQKSFSDAEYLASVFDACFVVGFATAEEELISVIGSSEVKDLLASEASVPRESLWAEVYFIHSLYNEQEANRSNEFGYLVNAVKLQRLARCLNEAEKEVRVELEKEVEEEATPKPSLTILAQVSPGVPWDSQKWLALGGFLLIVVAVFGGVYLVRHKLKQRRPPLTDEERLQRLDDLLLEHKISESTYNRLQKRYGLKKTRKAGREARKTSKKK